MNRKTRDKVEAMLDRPRERVEELKRLEERIAEVGDALVTTAMRLSPDKVHSETPITMEDQIVHKMELEQKFERELSTLYKDCDRLKALFRTGTEQEYKVMVERYCNLRAVRWIADRYGLTERHIYRICNNMRQKIAENAKFFEK